jgi:hypothetical protein
MYTKLPTCGAHPINIHAGKTLKKCCQASRENPLKWDLNIVGKDAAREGLFEAPSMWLLMK